MTLVVFVRKNYGVCGVHTMSQLSEEATHCWGRRVARVIHQVHVAILDRGQYIALEPFDPRRKILYATTRRGVGHHEANV